MSFQMLLWEVQGENLVECSKTSLDSEKRLENWIEKDVSILGINVLLIGRQVHTRYGGYVDLLAIDEDGSIVIIELKKGRTPREVVAQILDYAAWVTELEASEITSRAKDYLGRHLAEYFLDHFGMPIPETINSSRRMIIVASELDDSSERIVQYLASEYSLDINVVFFTCFEQDGKELIGRSWLMDPEEVEDRSVSKRKVPWSGYWFVNVGEGPNRNWEDCRKYGFLAAGQGEKYSKPLKKLEEGDAVFAYMKGQGYVGYGKVTKPACMAKNFIVEHEKKALLDLPLTQPGMKVNCDDPQLSEWVFGVKWLKTFPREEAKTFPGVFANQNIVCKIRQEDTVEFLKDKFGVETA